MIDILPGIPTTAAEWQLYSNKEGAEKAAIDIAASITAAVRLHITPEIMFDQSAKVFAKSAIVKAGMAALDRNSDFGATDGEAQDVLFRLMREMFSDR